MPKRNDLEQKALQLITNKGEEGVLQSELWRELGASSREGSRVGIKLEKKKMIRREKELHNGRWTYRLYPKKRPVLIDSILDSPCLMCQDSSKCGSGSSITPQTCVKLTEWLFGIAEKDFDNFGDS